ncbi:MAG: ATP-binding protein [Deferrisomatales bacterium]
MTAAALSRRVALAKGGILGCLLLALLALGDRTQLPTGAAALGALAAYHFFTERRRTCRREEPSRLVWLHLLVYTALGSLLVWVTTGERESPYWVVYLLPVTLAAECSSLRSTVLVSVGVSAIYAALLPFTYFQPPLGLNEEVREFLGVATALLATGMFLQGFSARSRAQLEVERALNRELVEEQAKLRSTLARLREAEERLHRKKRLAALGEMAGRIAHEFRNPLGILSASAQLLDEKIAGGGRDVERLLSVVRQETERLDRLLGEFLRFGRPNPLDPRREDLAALARRVVEQVEGRAQAQGVALDLDLSAGPVWARIDGAAMEQVLLNLLMNALDATGEGDTVECRVQRRGALAVVEVRDTGPGVPAEILDEVFQPFVTTREKGAGLGLANAYRTVDAHGGDLQVHNDPHGGAVFTVSLPAEPPPEA